MEDNKEALIKSIFANNKSGAKSRECYIFKYFPNEYINIINHPINKINDIDWFRKLYNYINGLKEIPLCKVCGAQVNFINIRRGYNGCCSINCLNKSDDKKRKTKKTNLIKYGFENPGTNAQVKEKRNATNLIKYGDSNFNNNAEIKKKIKETCITKYGCTNPSQFNEFKNKRKNTFMERYGVDHYSKTKEFNEKCKKTNMERYGTDYYSSGDEAKKKISETCMLKYGKKTYLQSEGYHEKTKKSNLEKYGTEKHYLSKTYKERIKKNNLSKRILNYANKLCLDVSNIEIDNDMLIIKNYCKIHNVFIISIKNLYNRIRLKHENICTQCNPISDTSSIKEKEIVNFIENDLNIKTTKFKINGKEIDVYVEANKFGIELNGLYWHSNLYKNINFHLGKTIECEKNGMQLLHIFENEWMYKKEIIKSIIKSKLGIIDNKIFAEKCVIKEINASESKKFLENNHIDGNINAIIRIGLFYDDMLVSIMALRKKRIAVNNKINTDGEYEILRFCNKLNTTVVDGATKLLNYFIEVYNPKLIIVYMNRRYPDKDLYLNFVFTKYKKPNYYYFKIHEYTLFPRTIFRKDILVKQGFDANKTEHQIMKERGYLRIYDCGQMKFELRLR